MDKKSVCFLRLRTLVHEHSWNVCVRVTEARQDKGESGREPSEQIKDEPERARRWMRTAEQN